MLHKIRIALVVTIMAAAVTTLAVAVTMMATPVLPSVHHAVELGFHRGGNFGLFGF